MRGIVKASRRPPAVRPGDRNGGFPHASRRGFRAASRMARDAPHRRAMRSWPKTLGSRLYGSLSTLLGITGEQLDIDVVLDLTKKDIAAIYDYKKLYQGALIMTHRDRVGDPPGRRGAAGDAGHRQGFPTPSGGSPRRPERRLPKAFGRRRLRLAMPRIATPRAPGRKTLGSRLYESLSALLGIRQRTCYGGSKKHASRVV